MGDKGALDGRLVEDGDWIHCDFVVGSIVEENCCGLLKCLDLTALGVKLLLLRFATDASECDAVAFGFDDTSQQTTKLPACLSYKKSVGGGGGGVMISHRSSRAKLATTDRMINKSKKCLQTEICLCELLRASRFESVDVNLWKIFQILKPFFVNEDEGQILLKA